MSCPAAVCRMGHRWALQDSSTVLLQLALRAELAALFAERLACLPRLPPTQPVFLSASHSQA